VKEALPPTKKKKQSKNNRHLHLAADELQRITGMDLTCIDGVYVMVMQKVINEVGLDTSPGKPRRTSLPGWDSVPTIGSVGTKCSLAGPVTCSTARQMRFVWERQRC
jgi:hypothetical protein